MPNVNMPPEDFRVLLAAFLFVGRRSSYMVEDYIVEKIAEDTAQDCLKAAGIFVEAAVKSRT